MLKRPTPSGGAPVPTPTPQAPPQAVNQTAPVRQAPPTPPPAQPPVNQAPVNQAPPQSTAVANTPPQTNGSGAVAMMDFHNQGGDIVLDGFDEWNGGNYVTVDGSDFYFKASETRVRELSIVVSYARQYFKFYDKDTKQWHESPTKLDNRYSLAAELKWYDWVEGEDEPKEFTMSISTTSTMVFREYVQKLRDSGTRINSIWTRMTIERLERIDPDTKEKQRYSRLIFTNAGPVEYAQQA